MSDVPPAVRAYAYHCPSDPLDDSELLKDSEGSPSIWDEPIQLGERFELSVHEIVLAESGRPEHVLRGSGREWEVVAVEPGPDDGERVNVRGWRKQSVPIWSGVLVLRRVGFVAE
jgi:hypothetical protein